MVGAVGGEARAEQDRQTQELELSTSPVCSQMVGRPSLMGTGTMGHEALRGMWI